MYAVFIIQNSLFEHRPENEISNLNSHFECFGEHAEVWSLFKEDTWQNEIMKNGDIFCL